MLRPSDRAPGLLVGAGVALPDDAAIGANVVIHAGVTLGAGVRIQDGAVVGKALVLGTQSQAERREPPLRGEAEAAPFPVTVVGAGATIAAGAVVVAGAAIGDEAFVGDQAHVRERAVLGEGSAIGRGSAVDNDVIVGARVRVQTGCYLTAFSVIEDDVFIGPGVFTFNDNTMGRHEKGAQLKGATLRRACRVGGGALILPGIEVGEEAFVATGSVVTRDVPARTLVMGSPAKHVRDIADEELIDGWR